MANFAQLNAAIAALTTQVEATEGIEASAVALISGFAGAIQSAVEAALTADNAADDATLAAVTEAISSVTTRFTASAGVLGDAVVANNPIPPVV